MTNDPIPVDVQQFILRHIDSIAQLEALLLLSRNPAESWTATGVARRLYVTEPQAADLLAGLRTQGFIAEPAGEPGAYRYQPQTGDLDALVQRVTEVYQRHLVPVTNLVHAKARLRVQEFADAFRLRKEEKE